MGNLVWWFVVDNGGSYCFYWCAGFVASVFGFGVTCQLFLVTLVAALPEFLFEGGNLFWRVGCYPIIDAC